MNKNDFLEKQLDRVNSWLNFAEAKNVALIALNVSLLTIEYDSFNCVVCLLDILLVISILICLFSFWPDFSGKGNSPIFYKDIAESEKEYYEMINDYFGENDIEKLNEELAKEIKANSKITMKKYKLFKVALAIDFVAFVSLAAIFIAA